jgi:hypothetical protein
MQGTESMIMLQLQTLIVIADDCNVLVPPISKFCNLQLRIATGYLGPVVLVLVGPGFILSLTARATICASLSLPLSDMRCLRSLLCR